MNKTMRVEKGQQDGSEKGEDSVYMIPRDDMPDGLVSGERAKIILEGIVNIDEQGASIKLEKITCEALGKPYSRTDPAQDKIEKELTIQISS